MGIISALFLGWFLGLFGFKGVVIAGMAQVFGIKISVLGYYFIFAMMGVLSWITVLINRLVNRKASVNDLNKAVEKFGEIMDKFNKR